MHAYTPEGWENFFVTVTGAAAALAGLIFVALSINLTRIVAAPALAARAREVIVVLFCAIAAGICGLVPKQPESWLGWELILTGGFAWVSSVRMHLRTVVNKQMYTRATFVLQLLTSQASCVPFILGGIDIVTHDGPGLYWLVLGYIFSFFYCLLHAWVLLIEIVR